MPPPRKIDMIPNEIRLRLQDHLKDQGFADYLKVTELLNEWLDEAGVEMTVGKSAVHAFGQEYEQMAKTQEEASAWAVSWMQDNSLEEEAQRHSVLFQMVSTLAFKSMKAQMTKDGDEIDPRELHFIGKMLKDIMSSSGIREKLSADERDRIATEAAKQAKEDVVDDLTKNSTQYGLAKDTLDAIKRGILMGDG
jgi:hypothetical protein